MTITPSSAYRPHMIGLDVCNAVYDATDTISGYAKARARFGTLIRREELQQRVDHLESGIQSALEYWNRSETDGAMVDALFTIEERLEKALDAKEQDAPATTDENATGGRV